MGSCDCLISSWNKHVFVYLSPKTPKEKRVCAQMKNVLRVYNYFDNLEQRAGGRGALYRTSEATGNLTSYCCMLVGILPLRHNNVGYSEKTIKRVRSECAVSGMDFSSPAKRYKSSRQLIVVDESHNGFCKSHNICKRSLPVNVCLL